MEEKRNAYRVWLENLKERHWLEVLILDERLILKCILNRMERCGLGASS
jgi:hypothetical protein